MAASIHTATLSELAWTLRGKRTLVITGAGISTDSGIPDYRGPQGSLKKRSPITFSEFMRSEAARQRYWSRSALGRPLIASAHPNAAHRALAQLEAEGVITGVVTQNVDGLHTRAGSREVVELHGNLARVLCLDCGNRESRAQLQERILRENPGLLSHRAEHAPDGDAELPQEATRTFRVPRCSECGGLLKPDLVFFGENVPAERVADVFGRVEAAEAMLVLGSSLTVYSGYRFVERASRREIPIAIVNLGETRADRLATISVEAPLSDALPRLAQMLRGGGDP